MDTIDRQSAIDAMRIINDSICEQQAVDALYDLPSAQPEQRWIPATERLPEEMGDYLVCDNCQNIYVNEWITTTTTWSWHYDDGRITAWMPLPEPWKGEDND